VPTVSLRYFTVYRPRQRPDGDHRLFEAACPEAFPLYGDGRQVRDFTFVAIWSRLTSSRQRLRVPPGSVINISGGSADLMEVVNIVGELTEDPVELDRYPSQPGDVERTGGSTESATQLLGWAPRVGLAEGLAAQLAWHRERRAARGLASIAGRSDAVHTLR
jgi:nucleoside-diphosphate-sugar epimerase